MLNTPLAGRLPCLLPGQKRVCLLAMIMRVPGTSSGSPCFFFVRKAQENLLPSGNNTAKTNACLPLSGRQLHSHMTFAQPKGMARFALYGNQIQICRNSMPNISCLYGWMPDLLLTAALLSVVVDSDDFGVYS